MNRFACRGGAALAFVLALSAPTARAAAAKAAPVPAPGSARDFSGIWENPENQLRVFDSTAKSTAGETPPLNATWAAEWAKTRERVRAGMKVWDPNIVCMPPGMPRTMNASYPFELLMTPGRITLIEEYFNEIRKIYTDGRSHPGPDDLEPTFSGHSIGHWEGDTLVVDTVGLRYETVIDLAMIPHSDQLHVAERIRKVGPDTLEWTLTLTDPVVFTRPWSSTKRYIRSPAGSEIREYVCAENNQPDAYAPSPDDAKYAKPDKRLKTLP